MNDSPQAAEERPLVTFALFAYNQEDYIREAVEGAFSQTYEPLEIILSDDCSSDRTFAIMQEMAAAYNGPHHVVARRNPINLMTALHVQAVADEMNGEWMVVAAGDDISLPNRVASLIDVWISDGANAVVLHSQARLMYENNAASNEIAYPRTKSDAIVDIKWHIKNHLNPLLSPTAAYHKEIFTRFPKMIGGSIIEDGPLVNRGFLCGLFMSVNKPLIIQRKLSYSSGTGYTCENIPRWNQFIRSKIISGFNKIQDIPYAKVSRDDCAVLSNRIHKDIRGLSRLVFKNKPYYSILDRARMSFSIFMNYPLTYKIKGRIGFSLKFGLFFK